MDQPTALYDREERIYVHPQCLNHYSSDMWKSGLLPEVESVDARQFYEMTEGQGATCWYCNEQIAVAS